MCCPPPATRAGNANSVTAGMDRKVVLWNLRLEKAERNFPPKKVWVVQTGCKCRKGSDTE